MVHDKNYDSKFDEYRFPDDYLKDLYTNPVNTQDYNLAQGRLHDIIAFEDSRGSRMDATQISRALNRGDIDIAENMITRMLEKVEE